MPPRLTMPDTFDSGAAHSVMASQVCSTAVHAWGCQNVANGRISQFCPIVAFASRCSSLLFLRVDQFCLERMEHVCLMRHPLKIGQSVVCLDAVLMVARHLVRGARTWSDKRFQHEDMDTFTGRHSADRENDEGVEAGWRACLQKFADMRSFTGLGAAYVSHIRHFVDAVEPRQRAPFFR